ncbi:FAD/NAD(P)-binding domain-containing protein [Coniochaeta ligniaria NRRL 30616]|uniref:FAD/NAD(P)-binding domain-containing protein n=1 Tax=Coniochaeta ligniaria NRRL 30616 TaxID=1408157 RepID=A0A1J7INZ6_9PEZI|nr:FAD/NAD(P)-binding domain-containing protein [Coniochaeta ligniaria NRRL 30616]
MIKAFAASTFGPDTTGPEPDKLKIAIIGGGICGLALAAGLCKISSLEVHVYEAVSKYKALHLNAIKAMASIGPEVRQAYFNKATNMGEEEEEMVTQVILAQGPHMGELVAELGRAKGRKSVSRADLLAGLLELVPKRCITFNKKLRYLEEAQHHSGVLLEFEDGTYTEADCVLGADGIRSMVRKYVLGAEHPAATPKNHDQWQVYRTLVTVEEARKFINERWTRNVPILLGPKGHVNCIPLNKGTRLSAGVAVKGAALADGGDTKPLDPDLYKDYSEDAQQIVRLVARDTSASWSVGDHDHAPRYHKGRVAVVGDAAHASLPFAGNGAAQALEDAAVLNHIFREMARMEPFLEELALTGEQRIVAVLAAYDSVRRPRSQAVVDLARKFGRIYAFAEDGLHDDPQRMKEFFASAASFTNDVDVEQQNKDAIAAFWSYIE